MSIRLPWFARHFTALVLTTLALSSAHTMEMNFVHEADYSKFHVVLSGEIKSGDYKRFESMYLKPLGGPQDMFVAFWMASPIYLDSKGGSLDEALKIAELINRLSMTVVVEESAICASACSLLFMAGATRVANGRIGLHRIYFNPSYYRNMPMPKARQLYEKNEEAFKERMLKYGLPQYLFERMMRTASDSIYWLTPTDIENIGYWPPYMEERMIAKCGARPVVENAYSEKWFSCMKDTVQDANTQSLFTFRRSRGIDLKVKIK